MEFFPYESNFLMIFRVNSEIPGNQCKDRTIHCLSHNLYKQQMVRGNEWCGNKWCALALFHSFFHFSRQFTSGKFPESPYSRSLTESYYVITFFSSPCHFKISFGKGLYTIKLVLFVDEQENLYRSHLKSSLAAGGNPVGLVQQRRQQRRRNHRPLAVAAAVRLHVLRNGPVAAPACRRRRQRNFRGRRFTSASLAR